MTPTWDAAPAPPMPPPGAAGWLRVALRGTAMGSVVFGGLALLLVMRLFERPVWRARRPLTPHITRAVCRISLRILGLRLILTGAPMRERGALTANHSSWLDIFVLNAAQCVYFVSKSEVARWPGIGWLARATGTVFIRRDPREARVQTALIESRLLAGHRLLFFPEGTSTDGLRVLPFKSTLFAAFFGSVLRDVMQIQPVTVLYRAPPGQDARFYGWWGDMAFGPHLLHMLAAPRHGSVRVTFHPPVRVDGFNDRKTLTRQIETTVRTVHDET